MKTVRSEAVGKATRRVGTTAYSSLVTAEIHFNLLQIINEIGDFKARLIRIFRQIPDYITIILELGLGCKILSQC